MDKITAYSEMVLNVRTGKPVYEVGKTYTSSNPEDIGYFSFENPLDLVIHKREHLYSSVSDLRFMEVELHGHIGRDEDDYRIGASCMTVLRELTIQELFKICSDQAEACMEPQPSISAEFISGEKIFQQTEKEWIDDEELDSDSRSDLQILMDILPKYCRLRVKMWLYSLKSRIQQIPVVACLRMMYSTRIRIIPENSKTRILACGKEVRICTNGLIDQVQSRGKEAHISSSASVVRIESTGNEASITSSGDFSRIQSTGKNAAISTSGFCEWIECDSDNACISSSARFSKISSTGHDCAIMCAGQKSIARAKTGSWITLAEWNPDHKLVCMRTAKVDDKFLKADVYYQLIDGQFCEALQEDLDEFDRVYASLPEGVEEYS